MDTGPISFGTDGWRATLEQFTDSRVRAVAQAIADTLRADEPPADDDVVVVGYDARETSEGFAESIAAVLAGAGFDVRLPHRDRPTPLLVYAVRELDARGAVVVTASHNPPSYNGVKFIPSDAAPALPAVTNRIEANLAPPAPRFEPGDPGYGEIERTDLRAPHASHARKLVTELLDGPASLSELTVAYDAMHGSGRGVTDRLLAEAGADVRRLRCETDPTFGGSPPEPSPEQLTRLERLVTDGDADLGIANDGDADRLAVVTPDRGVLDANLLFAASYDALLETNDGPAVRTVSTTFLIDQIASAHGTHAAETAVGFKWVAAAMADHDALIGGEESGGFSVRGHVREKDGALCGLLAAAIHRDRSYDDRLDELTATHGPIVADKRSLDCPDDAKQPVIDALGDAIPDTIAGRTVEDVSTVDGFKLVTTDGSWLLVRPSGTEPKMRVYAESDNTDATEELLAAGCALVEPVVDRVA